MLERETERMVCGTMMPKRMRELFAALDNDRSLIQECVVRPMLVDRLARSCFAFDERVHGVALREAEAIRPVLNRAPYPSHRGRTGQILTQLPWAIVLRSHSG